MHSSSDKQDKMAIKDEDDHQTQASEPLITDVEQVEIVAPTSLPEGYGLEVSTSNEDGQVVHARVSVPEGGVAEGERFIAQAQYMDIPTDRWRDGLFDCLALGCTHPIFCTGLFCFPIVLAQVMTRMYLNWVGDHRDPDTNPSRISSFKVVMTLFVIYLICLYMSSANVLEELIELPFSIFLPMSMSWFDFLFWVYCFVLVMKTRSFIRRKYSIPEYHCYGFEDCCCAFFCLPLTVCQMARHTADYDTYRAAVCSENGLPPNAPVVV